MEDIIRLEKVVKMSHDGKRAINGVTMSILDRECVTIISAPGSGKTTLVRLISGLDKPSDGQVFVLGNLVNEMRNEEAAIFRNKNIGILHRNPAFLDNLSVLDNVAMPLIIRGDVPFQRRNKVMEQMKTLGLQYTTHARPTQLSPLERHKAAIARALITEPRILLLDDFAASLSITDEEEIKATLYAICSYGTYTVVELTGADSGLICTDRTVVLDHGKIQEEQK